MTYDSKQIGKKQWYIEENDGSSDVAHIVFERPDGTFLKIPANNGNVDLSAPFSAGSQSWQAIAAKLKRNAENVSVVVLSDSTGVDQGGYDRWVGQMVGETVSGTPSHAGLADRWPAYTTRYHTWDDAAAAYDVTVPVRTIKVGTGSQFLDIYNASISGTIMHSPLGVNPGLTTTLSGALTNVATALALTAWPWANANVDLLIDQEIVTVTAGANGTTPTVSRGQYGTTAAAHSSGAIVSLAPRWINMLREIQPDLVFVSYGHNESSLADVPNRLMMLCEMISRDCSEANVILIAQNPSRADNNQALRATAIETYAQRRGFGFIDVHQYFKDNSLDVSANYVDNIHPNAAGSLAWATCVLQHLVYSSSTVQPRHRETSSLNHVGLENLIINGDFSDFGASSLGSWTAVGGGVATKTTTADQFLNPATGYAMKITAPNANQQQGFFNSTAKVANLRGRWITLLAWVFVPVGSSVTQGLTSISDGVSSVTAQTPGVEGQGMFRPVVVSKRVAKNATAITVNIYSEQSTAIAVTTGFAIFDRVCLAAGRLPRDMGVRRDGSFQTDLKISSTGSKFRNREGTNAAQGVATMVAGAVTVPTTAVKTGDRIRLQPLDDGGGANWGSVSYGSIVDSTNFGIKSSNGADTRQVFWEIIGVA